MFRTLLIKEWKEKALIALFGLGLMAVLLAAFLIFGDSRDLRELIPAGFLIIFFPFIGLILGAGAFESEFRNGAWAYLLSRPVRKETIWLAKLTALLSILAGFWLVFIGLMAVVPGLGQVVAGYKFPDILEAGLEFFPLILLSSVLYFSVAFSLSILSEKQLSLVFGSLFLGFALQGLLSYFAFQAEGRDLLSRAGLFPWIDAFKLALVLSSLAFLGASLLSFRKADFSQPKKKAASLAKYSLLFLALAWLLSAAWPAVRPGPKEEINSGIEVMGGEAFFSTTRGLYRYDSALDKLKRIARWISNYSDFVIGGGKVLYSAGTRTGEGPPLRVMNADGSGKTLLEGGEQNIPPINLFYQGFKFSPDGKTAVIVAQDLEGTSFTTYKKSLWSIRTDGTGSKKLPPLESALAGGKKEYSWLGINAWLSSSDRLLLMSRPQEAPVGVWTYNLATGAQARLFEGPRLGHCSVSPSIDVALIVHEPEIKGPIELSFLDLASGGVVPVMTVDSAPGSIWFSVMEIVWNRKGDRAAFLVQNSPGVFTPAIYVLPERRVIMPEDVKLEGPPTLRPSLVWIGDEKLMVGIPKERSVRILGPGLAGEKTISVPDFIDERFALYTAGDAVLLQDFGNDPSWRPASIWRLDLKTEKWKKIW